MPRRKRTDNLCCEDYFMAVAILATERCDDTPRVGACVINKDNKVIGIGYNRKLSEEAYVHAEVDAILNANSKDLKGCSLYVTSYPCNNCAKIIIQSGIRSVYYNESAVDEFANEMFEYANVTSEPYVSEKKIIEIDIDSINNIHSSPASPLNPWESTDEIQGESNIKDKTPATHSPSAKRAKTAN